METVQSGTLGEAMGFAAGPGGCYDDGIELLPEPDFDGMPMPHPDPQPAPDEVILVDEVPVGEPEPASMMVRNPHVETVPEGADDPFGELAADPDPDRYTDEVPHGSGQTLPGGDTELDLDDLEDIPTVYADDVEPGPTPPRATTLLLELDPEPQPAPGYYPQPAEFVLGPDGVEQQSAALGLDDDLEAAQPEPMDEAPDFEIDFDFAL